MSTKLHSGYALAALMLAACGGGDSPSGPDGTAPCTATSNPVFTSAVTDLAQLAYIVPLGEVQGQRGYTSHTYLTNSSTAAVPVKAPIALEVYNVVSSGVDYAIEARVNCNVFVSFGHITAPAAELVAIARSTHMGLDPSAPAKVTYAAGALMGNTSGTAVARTWDLGVYNRARTAAFLNPVRTENHEKAKYSTCPYDYYGEPLKGQHYAIFGPLPRALPATCRSAERGVAGTIAGTWFENAADREDAPINPAISPMTIASDLFGGVRHVVGSGGILFFEGVPLPETVTTAQCYPSNPGYSYFKLASSTELQFVRSNSGACPSVFPSTGYTVYRR